MKKNNSTRREPGLISYQLLRKWIGILGILLPLILVTGSFLIDNCREIQDSISAYYFTRMRDVFVGMVSAIGLFLMTYKGYGKTDTIASNLGGVFAFWSGPVPDFCC